LLRFIENVNHRLYRSDFDRLHDHGSRWSTAGRYWSGIETRKPSALCDRHGRFWNDRGNGHFPRGKL